MSVLLNVYCVPLFSWAFKEVRKILDPLELELSTVKSCHLVLGIKPSSSARKAALHCGAFLHA